MKNNFITLWISDFWGIMTHELKQIFTDGGVLLIFFVGGMLYPLLYNIIYLNGILEDVPIAVVDDAACIASRRFIREVDATRELTVDYKCVNMAEAERLMQQRKVKGILYFPSDFGEKLAHFETATLSLYTDMSSFLYYKNAMMATNFVMLHEIGQIQIERYNAIGMTSQEAAQILQPLRYEENNPFNRAFDYRIFLVTAILMLIIQQTMFYGMSLLAGTARERKRSFATLRDRLEGRGVGRVMLGRGAAYWLLYLGIGLYIASIVPALFGLPQRGEFGNILVLLLFFITDCVFFSMAWSTFATRRESVFLLFLVMSPIAILLTGCSWPDFAFPKFWLYVAYLFPSTFGVQGFINLNTAGGDLNSIRVQLIAMTVQTIVYYILASIAIYVEHWMIEHQESIKARRNRVAGRIGIDKVEDNRIIAGE